MRRVSILGSTGSIGTQALQVVGAHPDDFVVVGLGAGRNVQLLADQVRRFKPAVVSVGGVREAEALRIALQDGDCPEILVGQDGLVALAEVPADLVLVSVVGACGMVPTLRAIATGHDVALANKETLVAGGELVRDALAASGTRLIPVDSEHSAIFQCLSGGERGPVSRVLLTASGGPFREWSRERLAAARPEDALKHPNWSMGAKITVDSATLMNKGLEVIEAHWLFGADYAQIQVVVHPESIVHSLVEFVDGSVLAQMGWPDMRLPIHYALYYPERVASGLRPLDLAAAGRLTFTAPDFARFPCLGLATQAGAAGGTWPAVMNAANEVAVAAFLAGEIGFGTIPVVIERVLERHQGTQARDVGAVLAADGWARNEARKVVANR